MVNKYIRIIVNNKTKMHNSHRYNTQCTLINTHNHGKFGLIVQYVWYLYRYISVTKLKMHKNTPCTFYLKNMSRFYRCISVTKLKNAQK